MSYEMVKVFDVSDWPDFDEDDGSFGALVKLGLCERNDVAINWNPAAKHKYYSQMTDGREVAMAWVNAQIFEECPEHDSTESVLLWISW